MGRPPDTLLIEEVVTQGDPLLVVLYGITLVHLVDYIQAVDPGILTPLYADDAEFYGYERRSNRLTKLLL